MVMNNKGKFLKLCRRCIDMKWYMADCFNNTGSIAKNLKSHLLRNSLLHNAKKRMSIVIIVCASVVYNAANFKNTKTLYLNSVKYGIMNIFCRYGRDATEECLKKVRNIFKLHFLKITTVALLLTLFKDNDYKSKGKRKVQGVCHNHKPQPFRDPKGRRKPTNLNKHKPNKRTKSTKISSLFLKRGNRNTKRTEKHKNKMTYGKTYNKSPCRINHKTTKSKTNTGTTALERSVEQSLSF